MARQSRRGPSAQIKVARDGEARRVRAQVAGKEVSRLFILPRQIQVGPGAAVRMAGIAGVGTDRAFRRQGLARRVYARAMAEIAREGYSCSGLFTGTAIVAHRLYREFGFSDTCTHRHALKVLDPSGLARRAFADLASKHAIDWTCRLALHLDGHRPAYLRLAQGQAQALRRRPSQVDLALFCSATTLSFLVWGRLTAEHATVANLLRWEGEERHWQRLRAVLAQLRPGVMEG